MEKELLKFYENIEFLGSKDVCKYEDKKGNLVILPISNLILNCEYVEIDEAQKKIAIYNGELDKDLELEKIKVTRKKDKFEKTKNEKDKGTIIDMEVEVSKVWFVRNGLRLSKAYNDKDKALAFVKETNEKIMVEAKLI